MNVLLAALLALFAADPAPSSRSAEKAESERRVVELAQQYEFLAEGKTQVALHRDPTPLLIYSNPIRGDVHGNVFVWTLNGHPEVIGAFFDYRSENKLDSEMHMLSHSGIAARRDGETFWKPAKPGVEFRDLPGAPKPGDSPPARSRQMKQFAERFRVERTHPEQGKEALRMLPKPIYRWGLQDERAQDGAIFAFVEGTDPEAFLLLETTEGKNPVWRYAFARMNIVPFHAYYEDKSVWSVGDVSWDSVFDKQEPYAIVRENPRRGLKRTK
jgi:hypothetical protein